MRVNLFALRPHGNELHQLKLADLSPVLPNAPDGGSLSRHEERVAILEFLEKKLKAGGDPRTNRRISVTALDEREAAYTLGLEGLLLRPFDTAYEIWLRVPFDAIGGSRSPFKIGLALVTAKL